MRIVINDRTTYSVTSREYTSEGYLRVPGRVARVGIQKYQARDLGITDRSPDSIINVYRPPDEVFSSDSLASYADADAVNDHPSGMVSSDTYKSVTVGHVSGPAKQDGDFVVAELIIKDKSAIKAVESGKVELSAGYEAEYDQCPGITEDGEEYEFIQRDIKINHVALVDKARAGPRARLFDHNKPEGAMPQITLDGRTVEVADAATGTLIQDIFDRKTAEVNKLTADMTGMEKEKEKLQAEKDAKDEDLEKLKAKSTDAAIQKCVVAVIDAAESARLIAGKGHVVDGVDVMSIKRAALAKFRDSVDWSDQSDAYVDAAFDMAVEKKNAEDEDEEASSKGAKDSLDGIANDMSRATADGDKPTARAKFNDGLSAAWKRTAGEEA